MGRKEADERFGVMIEFKKGRGTGYVLKACTRGSVPPGTIFITTPAIRSALKEIDAHKSLGTPVQIGKIDFFRDADKKTIFTTAYYPLGHIVKEIIKMGGRRRIRYSKLSLKARTRLQKIGLATLAELQIERDLLRRFGPGYKISTSDTVLDERLAQLHDRGRKKFVAVLLTTAIRKTKAQVIRQYRKSNPRQTQTKPLRQRPSQRPKRKNPLK